MYLKALEIQGFKSFPEKTKLVFEKDITAIVGPNGSGKSNISDAILWVMGEQRSKALRGGKMEDVIFGGTERRSAMGFAQVSLIIDNATRILDIDSSEVMITRRYYRSGESEYYLNRESVRLKDIHELLMDTGMGRDGYSIIGQGRISEIVSAKSTDRREIFEEAAGISRYRYRKEESEHKLERTEENMLRINDKIDELEMQVGPLKTQAETAKRYLTLRDELRGLEISVWMENLDKLHEQSKTVEADFLSVNSSLEQARRELDGIYAQTENLTEKMREKDLEAETEREKLRCLEASAAECESAAAVLNANIKNNLDSIERIRSELSEQEGRTRGIEAEISQHRERIAAITDKKAGLELSLRELNSSGTDQAMRLISNLVSKESELNAALSQQQTSAQMLSDAIEELQAKSVQLLNDMDKASERRKTLETELSSRKKEHGAASDKLAEINNVISGHRMLMGGREQKAAELGGAHTKLTIECRAMDSRIAMLSEMEKDFEGFSKAVKIIMRESSRSALRGVHGPVANLIKTDDRFALAIETALGGAMQNIVVDTPENGKAAIEHLKRTDGGRATFLPLSSIKGFELRRVPSGEEGYLGTAAELVAFDKKYSEIISNLLGRTVIVETLSDAIRITKKFDNQFRAVTLDGQVINAGGSMTGGSSSQGTGIISRANELKRLKSDRARLEKELVSVTAALNDAQRELNAAKYELEVAVSELTGAQENLGRTENALSQCRLLISTCDEAISSLESEIKETGERIKENTRKRADALSSAKTAEDGLLGVRSELEKLSKGREEFERRRDELAEALSSLRSEAASLDAERESLLRTIDHLESLRNDLTGDGEARNRAVSELERRNGDLAAELDIKRERLNELAAGTEKLKAEITENLRLKLEFEGKRTQSEKAGQNKNRELLDLERLGAAIEQKKLAAEMEEKQIIDKLWDSYELSRTAAQAARLPLESLQKATRRISELKREITSLGSPNLGAIEEYERISTRYNFLIEQRDDVEKARKELLKIIADITSEMKDIFLREFLSINESFKKTFLELFGGGSASLVLEDEENVLDCGIEIKVQPPGKALSKISLLSGGEMAFVAIALYFAILKVRPTPFCVMDEIEAALDEANVTRFAEYLRNISDKTQFLVITHRRGTMEEADMLYGVTMQEKGVSSIIDLDLDQVEKTIA
jgi:chromosome segregation protein